MELPSLQFDATLDTALMVLLMVAIALVLAGWGIWRLAMGNRRAGLAALGAAALLAVLLALAHGSSNAVVWLLLAGFAVALAVFVFYSAVYAYLGSGRLSVLMVLRFLAILLLLAILFKPFLSMAAGGGPTKTVLEVLVDRSGSMATADEAGASDRYTQSVRMLASQRERLEENFRVVWHHFGESLQTAESLDDLAELRPAGENAGATNIASALREASGEFSTGELAGILLLSDGIHNTSDLLADAAGQTSIPVYAIGVGSDTESQAGRRNIEIVGADAPLEAVVNNVTSVDVRVRLSGFATVPAEVSLFAEGDDRPVDTKRLWTDRNVATPEAKLKWTPREVPAGADAPDAGSGVRRLRVVVTENPAEVITDDNRTELHVLLTNPRIRVLYVEGSMRPEYKYLKRLLDTDPNVQFMSLVRVGGNSFWAYGAVDGKKLTDLPSSDEDFALFDVLVLGDLDRTFLTRERMSGIRRFVNDGGGLIMLGGHNSFGPGGYGGTDVEAVLPVVCGGRAQPQETTPFVPSLTAAGQAHPVFSGLDGFFAGPSTPNPGKLPALRGCVTLERAKPAASVLAVHPTRQNANGPLIVLAVQRFGAGRSAAFSADTTWSWYLPLRGLGAESPYERFWGQLVRWVAGVEARVRRTSSAVVVRPDRTHVQLGKQVKLLARAWDDKGKPAPEARVACEIAPAGGGESQTISMPSAPVLGAGLYETTWTPAREGEYTLMVRATDSQDQPLGSDSITVRVAPRSAETDRLARDEENLRLIASRSDGRYADISALPDVLDHVIARRAPLAGASVPRRRWPDWNRKSRWFTVLFVAFVALITGEWMLRRRWQLQ